MGKDNIRNGYTFYLSWEQAISKLDDRAQLEIYKAISRFSLFGEEPHITSPVAELCWELIKPTICKARIRSAAGSGEKPSLAGNQNASKRTKNEQNSNKKRTKNDLYKYKDKDKEYCFEPANAGQDTNDSSVSDEQSEPEAEQKAFLDNLSKLYPTVMKMQQPLTFEQCQKLSEAGYTSEQIHEVLGQMENRIGLRTKYKSSYATLLNWLKRNNDGKR